MTLYERIKNRREELHMSQDELALKLGYKSRSTIAKIESGENDITQSKIAAFAKALQTTPSYLMGWDEKQNNTPYHLNPEIAKLAQFLEDNPIAVAFLLKYIELDERGKALVNATLEHEYEFVKGTNQEKHA